ncbi:hypothetical protein VTK56DRAFT_7795 [Thermocarpiscus australiensis]
MEPPSIQSFYRKEASSSPPKPTDSGSSRNDKFTPEEIEVALRPLTQVWKPKGTYEQVTIADLQPGPGKVRFTARIVNFSLSKDGPNRPMLPQGFHFLVVKDNTGAVAIKLSSTGIDDRHVQLGAFVTVWTAFVGECSASYPVRVPLVSMIIPVHPAQGSASCIKFHHEAPGSKEADLCRRPLEYDPSFPLPGLMNLKAYLNSGHDGVPDAKVLVCVSSVGSRRAVRSEKAQSELSVVEVRVFDETASCVLKMWEDKVASARGWISNQTILLLSNPRLRLPERRNATPELSIGITSMIDIDPSFPEADWLRRMAVNRTKKESLYHPFPAGIWDAETAIHGPDRVLFTLAEIDDFVRDDPEAVFTGKLNMIITGVSITDAWRRGMLCCFECCGVPLYANKPVATCKNCETERSLSLNPRIVGHLMDETGSVAAGKLIWSDRAWIELLFGTCIAGEGPDDGQDNPSGDQAGQDGRGHTSWKELTGLDSTTLRAVEEQLQYARVTLTFGWSPIVGRLCVLGVEW